MTGEEILKQGVIDAHKEVFPNANFNWVDLIPIALDILERIRACRNPAVAALRMKQGGVVAFGVAFNACRAYGYNLIDSTKLASVLAAKGAALSDAERKSVLDEAADIPKPDTTPVSGGGWPIVAIAAMFVLGLTNVVQASWPLPDYNDFNVSIDADPKPPQVVTPPKAKDPLEFPYHQQWPWPGGTHQSLYDHLVNDPRHRLPAELLEGRSFQELIAIHNSSHDGMLYYNDPPTPDRTPRATPTVRASPTTSNAPKTVQAVSRGQPARSVQVAGRGLFGRRIVYTEPSYSQSGGCP